MGCSSWTAFSVFLIVFIYLLVFHLVLRSPGRRPLLIDKRTERKFQLVIEFTMSFKSKDEPSVRANRKLLYESHFGG